MRQLKASVKESATQSMVVPLLDPTCVVVRRLLSDYRMSSASAVGASSSFLNYIDVMAI